MALAGAILMAAGAATAAESYVLPSSVFRTGTNAAEYRTDVRLLNQGTEAVTVRATFYDQVTSTPLVATSFPVAARSQAAFDNILQSLFGRTLSEGAYGPIRFDTSGPVLVAASVNNVNACGSRAVSGQWLPAIDTSQALRAGVIGQLMVSASQYAGYRTNLVFMNPGSTPATATAKIRRGGGALLSTGTIGPLAANGFSQVALDAGRFPGIDGTTDTNLWLEFTSDQPVLAYATMIHNVSGDPFAVEARRDTPSQPGPEEVTYTLPGGVPLVLVKVPAGTFTMGSPETERGRSVTEQQHQVTLTADYFLGKYEVTQAQWQAVTGAPMSNACGNWGVGGGDPVYCVSWNDINGPNGFMAKLRTLLGDSKFRLPTEAEWERAARGGTQTRFSFGDALDGEDSCGTNSAAGPYVWWCGNAGSTIPAVGTKGANAYGLHDMHGSVTEWIEDWYGQYLPVAQTDPTGPVTGSNGLARGGGWKNHLYEARSAFRNAENRNNVNSYLGFRIARTQ